VYKKPYFTLWKLRSWKPARIPARALELEEHFRTSGYARNASYGASKPTNLSKAGFVSLKTTHIKTVKPEERELARKRDEQTMLEEPSRGTWRF
jgi:hypothetical protein